MSNIIDIKTNGSFSQANELIRATSRMDDLTHKLYFFCLSKREIGQDRVKSDATEIRKVLGIPKTGKNLKDIWEALKELQIRTTVSVRIPVYRHKLYEEFLKMGVMKTHHIIEAQAIIKPSLVEETKEVVFKINPLFIPLLDNLERDYGWAYIEKIARLKKKYSARIYEWTEMKLGTLEEYSFIWYFDMDSDTEGMGVRQFLGLTPSQYKQPTDLIKRVLDPAFKEINEKVDINITAKYLTKEHSKNINAVELYLTRKDSDMELRAIYEECCQIKPKLKERTFESLVYLYGVAGHTPQTMSFKDFLLN